MRNGEYYPAEELERMRRVENFHWWYRSLDRFLLSKLPDGISRIRTWADIGSGTGRFLSHLCLLYPHLNIFAVDPDPYAVQMTFSRGLKRSIQARASSLPFKDESLDAVSLIDVLYIQGIDEKKTLLELYRILRPGGSLLIHVPAFNCLRSSHDRYVLTRERYQKNDLTKKLRAAGFEIIKASYWNFLLFPFIAGFRFLQRFWKRSAPQSDLSYAMPGKIHSLLCGILELEFQSLGKIQPPWGTSLAVLARKPSEISFQKSNFPHNNGHA